MITKKATPTPFAYLRTKCKAHGTPAVHIPYRGVDVRQRHSRVYAATGIGGNHGHKPAIARIPDEILPPLPADT